MNRNYKLDKETTQRLLDLAVEDNLIKLHKKVGTKGNKAGVEEDAYRLPTEGEAGGAHAGGPGRRVELVRSVGLLLLSLRGNVGPLQLGQCVAGLVVHLLDPSHGPGVGLVVILVDSL